MISYEVAMGLSIVAVFLFAGTMSTSRIVVEQRQLWNVIPLFVSFAIYAIAIVGETNRAPFDLPEAESELVGGFHTEYSSFKFAMFFLAEYINMVTVSALATTLFLGGWRAPWPLSLWDGANSGWWPMLWFTGQGRPLHLRLRLAARHAAPPALRPVHARSAGRCCIPINLVWILAVAAIRRAPRPGLAGVEGDLRRGRARAAHRPGRVRDHRQRQHVGARPSRRRPTKPRPSSHRRSRSRRWICVDA